MYNFKFDSIWNRIICFFFGHKPNDFDCTAKKGITSLYAGNDLIIKVDMCGRCGRLYTNFEHGKMRDNDPNHKETVFLIKKD